MRKNHARACLNVDRRHFPQGGGEGFDKNQKTCSFSLRVRYPCVTFGGGVMVLPRDPARDISASCKNVSQMRNDL
jgi:hypothetical protein